MTGQCKYCRKRNIKISQFDRHPDNTLIRNRYGDAQGICEDCEKTISSTKTELLEALSYLKENVHMYIVMEEILNILPDEGTFNSKAIYEEITKAQIKTALVKHSYYVDQNAFDDLKTRIGYIVIAASRMKQEGTPAGRKRAAKSIFLRGLLDHYAYGGMGGYGDLQKLKKEFGDWCNKV